MRPMSLLGVVLLLAGCGEDPPAEPKDPAPTDPPTEPVVDGELLLLSPVDQLVRTSMALRGIRPSMEEMERVRADPEAIEVIVDEYLESEEFIRKIGEMHSEIFLLEDDIEKQLPTVGELEGYDLTEIFYSQVREPLMLVEHIVDNDKPYTEVVTADYMFTNDVNAKMWGLPYDYDSDEEWQLSHWSDGRPEAGLLSSAKIFRRFLSAGSNFNRARANMVASKFLCDDINDRDILLLGGVDVSDEFAVANAVMNVPECIACHQALDPLAGYFWGYMDQVESAAISVSHNEGCEPFDYTDEGVPEFGHNQTPEFMCYPIRQYNPFNERDWAKWNLREPNYYGTPAAGIGELGELIAADPRFHACTARHFFGYFDQLPAEKVPQDVVNDLQATFVESGFNAKALAREAVLREEFIAVSTTEEQPGNDPVVSVKAVRPTEYASMVEDLTGYKWLASGDADDCATSFIRSNLCWGAVDLNQTDMYGFRSMTGGIDSMMVTTPVRSVTAVKLIAAQMYAADASKWVVDGDFAESDAGARRLFKLVDSDTVEEAAVREQLAWLHARVLAEFVDPDDPVVDETYGLWQTVQGINDDTTSAWVVTLTAMLQDPRFIFY